jgi:FkbM family methyltransferase
VTRIVYDLGCYHHPDHQGSSQDSISKLVERFQPERLYGYDPHPAVPWFHEETIDGTVVQVRNMAAWNGSGTVAYDPRPDSPLSAAIGSGDLYVRCFDVASDITAHSQHSPGPDIVVKLDVEGAEYDILERVIDLRADENLELVLVEWHDVQDAAKRRRSILRRLRCPVEEWA